MVKKAGWSLDSEDVATIAARRVARGRNHPGFGNAGAARVLFEKAYNRSVTRTGGKSTTITVVDVIGPRPDPKTNVKLKIALEELDKMAGLKDVKDAVGRLLAIMVSNYDKEMVRSLPYVLSWLSALPLRV